MIPKRIFQTWKTKNLPRGIQINIKRIMELNIGYTHILYDDKEMDAFVNEHYSGEIADAYNILNIGASKADLWRYLVLYKYGGIYLDIDADIIKPLDQLIDRNDSAIITREQYEGLFNQWILIFKKNHPLLKEIINLCVSNIKSKSTNNILHLTGSTVITTVLNKLLTNESLVGDLWHTPDNILNNIFNDDEEFYKCRFYGIDMNEYALYHNKFYEELYTEDSPQWEIEQKIKPIFKNTIKNIGELIDKVVL